MGLHGLRKDLVAALDSPGGCPSPTPTLRLKPAAIKHLGGGGDSSVSFPWLVVGSQVLGVASGLKRPARACVKGRPATMRTHTAEGRTGTYLCFPDPTPGGFPAISRKPIKPQPGGEWG